MRDTGASPLPCRHPDYVDFESSKPSIPNGSQMKIIALLLLLLSPLCNAEQISIPATVPTGWLVQNYVPGSVVLWFTPSNCPNGLLQLPATATPSDHARLYSTVMAAKLTSAKLFLIYDSSAGSSQISSFGLS
jgi:hypothetical protein